MAVRSTSPLPATGYLPQEPQAQELPQISVIVPMHDEEESVAPLYASLSACLERLGRSYEVIIIDSAPPQVRADRPFLFAIRERFSGAVLFVGLIREAPAI